jgi:hypothetical protein
MRQLSIARLVVINIAIGACLLEIALRAQQMIGPLYDLDIGPGTIMAGLSTELNHAPEPGGDWDGNLIRRMDEPNAQQCTLRVLFMGDSFMQGLGRNETVPVHVRDFFRQAFGREFCVLNAGYSSYSPSIFVPQAKKLIPLLHPDLVVIAIDETDLVDDYYRYREYATRDADGSIVAVGPPPMLIRFRQGLVESTSKATYLQRLASEAYFTKIEFPALLKAFERTRRADIFLASRLPAAQAEKNFGAQIEYFKTTLEDLTRTVLSRMGGPDKLVYVHHPHLEHLKTDGDVFNDVVSAAVRDVAAWYNVRYYDATADLRAEFGTVPERYYIRGDMHFNPEGLRAYGTAVAKYLAASVLR